MPARSTAETWTNTSFEPSCGAMKPKPLVVLKNFTVPVVDMVFLREIAAPCPRLSAASNDYSGKTSGAPRRDAERTDRQPIRPREYEACGCIWQGERMCCEQTREAVENARN